MKSISHRLEHGFAAAIVAGALAAIMTVPRAMGTPITYDEILFQGTSGDPSKLLANVDMSLAGSVLEVKIQNVSLAGAADPAALAASMVSGIAFNLPAGIAIVGGSITPVGTTSSWTTTDAQKQWGYRNGLYTSGSMAYATYSYNAEASTLASNENHLFYTGANPPPNADGLNYGAVSQNIPPPGSPNVINEIDLFFTLSGTLPSNLVDLIDNGKIAVEFGSPTDGTHRIPDGGTTVVLLGFGLLGILGLGRRLVRG